MNEKQAFVLGFLAELADRGIPPHLMFGESTEKTAFLAGLSSMAGHTADIGLLGAAGLIGLPLLGGKLVGSALGAAGDVDKTDVEEAQAEELANLYTRETERLKRLAQERKFHQHVQRVGRPFSLGA